VVNSNATFTASRQTFTPGTAPVAGYEGEYFFRFDKSAGGSYGIVAQRIEDVRSFAGQTVTISFWAKVGSGTLTLNPYVDQNFGTGGSTTAGNTTDTVTVNTSWTRYTIQYAVPSMSGKTIGTGSFVEFSIGRVITASAYVLDLWGVQVEAGSVATAFQTATGTLQGELAACQRYYWRFTATGGGANYLCLGRTSSQVDVEIQHPVQMRRSPTDIEYGGTTDVSDINVAGYTVSTISFANASVLFASIRANVTVAGLAQGKTYVFGVQTGAYYGFSAEL
jgi:hypothetical protein